MIGPTGFTIKAQIVESRPAHNGRQHLPWNGNELCSSPLVWQLLGAHLPTFAQYYRVLRNPGYFLNYSEYPSWRTTLNVPRRMTEIESWNCGDVRGNRTNQSA